MTTLGSTSHQTDGGAEWFGSGNNNQFARKLTLPAGGPWLVTAVGAWFTGKDTAATYKLCLWNYSSGALLGSSASANASNEAFAIGASNSHQADLTTAVVVAGGTAVLVGYSRDPDEAMQHDLDNGVTEYKRTRSSWPGSMSGYVTQTDALQAWLIYELANTLPSAPTLSLPATGSRQITATPQFVFTHNDADSDPCASYDLQVSTDSSFTSVTHWNDADDTTGISGNTITRDYAGTALTRGTTYYWRCRTNDGVGDGTWSATRSFTYNALPTITHDAPASAALGVIWNIGSDLAIWSGSEAKVQIKFTPTDANGDTMTKYRLKLWNDNAGVKGTQLYDSGQVSLSMASGVQQTLNVTQGLANGTQYWWSIAVYDGYEWSDGTSDGSTGDTATKFKVRWAQGVFEYDTTVTTSTNWAMASGTTTKTVALLFGSSTGAARTGTTSGWATSMASITPYRYVQVLVRLTTDTAGTQGSLASMTFSYYATPSTPDGWTVS